MSDLTKTANVKIGSFVKIQVEGQLQILCHIHNNGGMSVSTYGHKPTIIHSYKKSPVIHTALN